MLQKGDAKEFCFSTAVNPLRGQPDPLKGDALNKEQHKKRYLLYFHQMIAQLRLQKVVFAVRYNDLETPTMKMPSDDRKLFISEVVDVGSATIKHGFSSLKQSPSIRKSNDTGSYRSPNLERSLTRENDRYEGLGSQAEYNSSYRFSKNVGTGSWDKEISTSHSESRNGDPAVIYSQKTREEKLLETIVTSTGMRLQPTRDALHVFLMEASKVDAKSLPHAIEMKLRSPMWQVRMKAICVLEAVLRKKNELHFSFIASYFGNDKDVVV